MRKTFFTPEVVQYTSIWGAFAGALTLFLGGCALLGPAHQFDAREYDLAVASSVAATRAVHQCIERGPIYRGFLQDLNAATMHLAEYEKFRPANEDALAGVNELRALVTSLTIRSTPTLRYCQHKLSEVQSAARVLAMTFGGQATLATCGSDAGTRYMVYRDSLESQDITNAEFAELSSDILRLQTIDMHGCSLEAKVRLKKTLETISKVMAFAGSL